MPRNEINITLASQAYPDFQNMISAAYRVAINRTVPTTGYITYSANDYDELDCLSAAFGAALTTANQMITDPGANTRYFKIYSDFGENLPYILCEKKPDIYAGLYAKLNDENNSILFIATLRGNNPLRNHIYNAALKTITGHDLPLDAADQHPQQWFTMRQIISEKFSKTPYTPAINAFMENTVEQDRMKELTPEIYQVIDTILNRT